MKWEPKKARAKNKNDNKNVYNVHRGVYAGHCTAHTSHVVRIVFARTISTAYIFAYMCTFQLTLAKTSAQWDRQTNKQFQRLHSRRTNNNRQYRSLTSERASERAMKRKSKYTIFDVSWPEYEPVRTERCMCVRAHTSFVPHFVAVAVVGASFASVRYRRVTNKKRLDRFGATNAHTHKYTRTQ